MDKNKFIAPIILLLVLGIAIGYYFGIYRNPEEPVVSGVTTFEGCVAAGNVVMESYPRQCRTADGALFVEVIPDDMSWTTLTDPVKGVTFDYPETMPAQYIFTGDWPPQYQILKQAFTCTETPATNTSSTKTEKHTVGANNYCVTMDTEGAAGNIYINYAYAFPRNGTTSIFTFSLRFVQCGNYPEPQKSACESEREGSFNLDNVLDRMAQSVR